MIGDKLASFVSDGLLRFLFCCFMSSAYLSCLVYLEREKKSDAFYRPKMTQSVHTMEDQAQEQTQRISAQQDCLCLSLILNLIVWIKENLFGINRGCFSLFQYFLTPLWLVVVQSCCMASSCIDLLCLSPSCGL